jgi:hypothetical protein
MSTVTPQTQPQPQAQRPEHVEVVEPALPHLRIYSHSSFFYWWPVWVVGYVMALITRFGGVQVAIGNVEEWFFPGRNLGLFYAVVLFLVILITNVTMRGLNSVIIVLAVMLVTVILAYFGLWEDLIRLLPVLSIHMNLGFYVFFSTLIFLVWAFSVFIYDRMSFWVIRPGQITHEYVIGGAEKSYDTHGMVFEREQQDLFRHWILGMGSGDLVINTMGAKRETLHVPNVLFVRSKVQNIQRMIAERPNQFAAPSVT